MELRRVDPRLLKDNPNNPRRTKASREEDAALGASIAAVGILEPPTYFERDGTLFVKYGHRRRDGAIAAGLAEIEAFYRDEDPENDGVRALAENQMRAALNPIDQWIAVEKLINDKWTEDAIALAFAKPVRQIRQLRLLAHIHPAMLEQMRQSDMPSEHQLCAIALAGKDDQAQVWKKYKPKKAQSADWFAISHALSKRRMMAAHARFEEDLAKAYNIVWSDDLFGLADQDNRFTTEVEAFLAAQQEWLSNNLPPNGSILQLDQYERPVLPKGAEEIWGKPGKHDHVGLFVNPHDGKIASITFRLPKPEPKRSRSKKTSNASHDTIAAPSRPPVTQKGQAILGDLRTDALHQALREAPAECETLLGLMVLAFGASNVDVTGASGNAWTERGARRGIAASLVDGNQLTVDALAITKAARAMLAGVLSCRENPSKSGPLAIIAGHTLGADDYLANFATEPFVACLSREQVEQAAKDANLRVYPRLKDTRQALLDHYREERFVPPIARFTPNEAELNEITNLATSEEDPAADENLGNRDDGQDEVTADPEPSDDNGVLQAD